MKQNTRIYNKWKGYTLADCDCKYYVYYGGKRKGKITCLTEKCVCEEEIRQAAECERRERKIYGS